MRTSTAREALASSASNIARNWRVTVVRAWAGIEAYMSDGIPVVGPSATSDGVFHQFGFSTHGFQLGPGTGAVMAELVATGSTNVPIGDLGIGRFKTS